MKHSTTDTFTELQHLYVIATVFNPAGFKKRYDLYYQFEKHMKDYGINLVTIECIYDHETEYAVTKEDNPLHIRVKTTSPLWHKENLINIAVSKLPSDWKYVLWIDADIEFLENDWPSRVIESFSKYDIIQVFKYAHFLGPDNKVLETHFSFTYSIANDLPISKKHYSMFYPHPGYAWGMTRKAYENLNGLIDYAILGSGDCHMAFALINRVEDSFCFPHKEFNENYLNKLKEWQKIAYTYTINNKVGFSDCTIKHYFHGYREDRKYVQRMRILTENNFNPYLDIIYDSNGIIQLNEDNKYTHIMKEQIRNYFTQRNEDKVDSAEEEKKRVSMNIKYKTPEEILENAQKVKKLIEEEKFKNIMKHMLQGRQITEKEKFKARSKSSENSRDESNIRNNRNRRNQQPPRGKKVIEMYYEMHLNGSMPNDNSDNESSSHNSSSTEELNSSLAESLNLSEMNPNRSFTIESSDELMYKYGNCCNKSSKPREERHSNLPSEGNDKLQLRNYNNFEEKPAGVNSENFGPNKAKSSNQNQSENQQNYPTNYVNMPPSMTEEEKKRKLLLEEEERKRKKKEEDERRRREEDDHYWRKKQQEEEDEMRRKNQLIKSNDLSDNTINYDYDVNVPEEVNQAGDGKHHGHGGNHHHHSEEHSNSHSHNEDNRAENYYDNNYY
jgi:hypothetical protein